MSTFSQNGWPLIQSQDSTKLRLWKVPAHTGEFSVRLQAERAGFVLAHWALWFAEMLEDVTVGQLDDWGWAPPKAIPGSTIYSNHGSGTALDLNAVKHPWNEHTFTTAQEASIRGRLPMYQGAIRWGGDYHTTIDQMHYEINVDAGALDAIVVGLVSSSRGQRLVKANPDLGSWSHYSA